MVPMLLPLWPRLSAAQTPGSPSTSLGHGGRKLQGQCSTASAQCDHKKWQGGRKGNVMMTQAGLEQPLGWGEAWGIKRWVGGTKRQVLYLALHRHPLPPPPDHLPWHQVLPSSLQKKIRVPTVPGIAQTLPKDHISPSPRHCQAPPNKS